MKNRKIYGIDSCDAFSYTCQNKYEKEQIHDR